MKVIDTSGWKEFEEMLESLYIDIQKLANKSTLPVSKPLFRGQSNSDWTLETTLERYTEEKYSLNDYYRKILAAKPQIETFTEKTWSVPSFSEYEEWLSQADLNSIVEYPAKEYLIYLRHHGFPSPLLDWTRTPYIAAHFAFNKMDDKKTKSVSIYAFIEVSGQGKHVSTWDPFIIPIGSDAKSHKRHFLQQSEYTVCISMGDDTYIYDCHENIIKKDDEKQDLILKFNIPVKERFNVLNKLENMNINAFSLFGNEESLMETMALRELYLQR